jgi:hypothetical protein
VDRAEPIALADRRHELGSAANVSVGRDHERRGLAGVEDSNRRVASCEHVRARAPSPDPHVPVAFEAKTQPRTAQRHPDDHRDDARVDQGDPRRPRRGLRLDLQHQRITATIARTQALHDKREHRREQNRKASANSQQRFVHALQD